MKIIIILCHLYTTYVLQQNLIHILHSQNYFNFKYNFYLLRILNKPIGFSSPNHRQNLYGQLRKTAFSLTPQLMPNQFKWPSAGSIREPYYIYRKTEDLDLRYNESRDHYHENGYLVPSPRYVFGVEAVSIPKLGFSRKKTNELN